MAPPVIVNHLSALADATRCRMLLLLERHELTVSELCAVLQLPQSTVSRHLKILADGEWVLSRRDGTSRFYTLALDERTPAARRLWGAVREQVVDTPSAEQDARRVKRALAHRRDKSQQFFASAAGQWDRLRQELFGGAFCARSLLAFIDETWVVGDLGCGTGQVAAALAPHVRRVVAVDESGEMLQAARRRLRGYENVAIRRGAVEALPVERDELDAAALVLVLHHLPEPMLALAEAARVLRPGGPLLIVDMLPHDREQYRQQMGHLWLGFSEERVARMLAEAGFERCQIRPLPTDPEAKGPELFAAVGRRAARRDRREAAADVKPALATADP